MRTLLRVTIPVKTGNATLKDGSLPKQIEATMAQLKPEAAYFFSDGGSRTAMFVFDMKDASEVASIGEPFFMQLDAEIDFTPVMNADDLMKGLQSA
jgi:hypothetical protein